MKDRILGFLMGVLIGSLALAAFFVIAPFLHHVLFGIYNFISQKEVPI